MPEIAGLSRRSIVKGVAWTVPVLTLAVAAPASAASRAASNPSAVMSAPTEDNRAHDGTPILYTTKVRNFVATVTADPAAALPVGTVVAFSLSAASWTITATSAAHPAVSTAVTASSATVTLVEELAAGSSLPITFGISSPALSNAFAYVPVTASATVVMPSGYSDSNSSDSTAVAPAFYLADVDISAVTAVSISAPTPVPASKGSYLSGQTYTFVATARNSGTVTLAHGLQLGFMIGVPLSNTMHTAFGEITIVSVTVGGVPTSNWSLTPGTAWQALDPQTMNFFLLDPVAKTVSVVVTFSAQVKTLTTADLADGATRYTLFLAQVDGYDTAHGATEVLSASYKVANSAT